MRRCFLKELDIWARLWIGHKELPFSLFPDSCVIWLVFFFVLSLIGMSAEKWIYHKWTQIAEGRYSYRGTLWRGWLGNCISILVLSISLGETPGNGSWFILSVNCLAEGGGKGSGVIQGGTSVLNSCVMSESYPQEFHLDSKFTSLMQTWGHYFAMWWRGKKEKKNRKSHVPQEMFLLLSLSLSHSCRIKYSMKEKIVRQSLKNWERSWTVRSWSNCKTWRLRRKLVWITWPTLRIS